MNQINKMMEETFKGFQRQQRMIQGKYNPAIEGGATPKPNLTLMHKMIWVDLRSPQVQ